MENTAYDYAHWNI